MGLNHQLGCDNGPDRKLLVLLTGSNLICKPEIQITNIRKLMKFYNSSEFLPSVTKVHFLNYVIIGIMVFAERNSLMSRPNSWDFSKFFLC